MLMPVHREMYRELSSQVVERARHRRRREHGSGARSLHSLLLLLLLLLLLMRQDLLLPVRRRRRRVPPRLRRRLRPVLQLVERRVAEGARVLHVQPFSQAEPVEEMVAPRHLQGASEYRDMRRMYVRLGQSVHRWLTLAVVMSW